MSEFLYPWILIICSAVIRSFFSQIVSIRDGWTSQLFVDGDIPDIGADIDVTVNAGSG